METVVRKPAKPIPNEPKDFASKRRDKWLNKLTDEFLVLEGLYPVKSFLPTENCPNWVSRLEEDFVLATHRGASLKDATKLTPMRVGGFLGYQCAYAVWMRDWFDDKVDSALKDPENSKKSALTKEEYEEALKMWQRWSDWYRALQRLAGRALKSCVYQSYADMSAFLGAFSSGFSKKPNVGAGVGDFGSTSFEIYHFMLWHWRAVERLDSVRALHDLLRRVVGEFRTGDLKRIEKICQRIGLHYRKRGRPKTSK
jgi:hypothetical protein